MILHLYNQKKEEKLIVDDEVDICMVYQIVLQDAGYDLILLDIKMPLLNGFELCKKVREVDKTTHIIFITASEEYYEEFKNKHFPELSKINYIQKPIGNDELVQIVNTIVANSITVD